MAEAPPEVDNADNPDEVVTKADAMGLFEVVEGPVLTTRDLRLLTGVSSERARTLLEELVSEGQLEKRVSGQMGLYWQRDPSEAVTVPDFLTDESGEE
jgi:predicted HTH transcriptional regulator